MNVATATADSHRNNQHHQHFDLYLRMGVGDENTLAQRMYASILYTLYTYKMYTKTRFRAVKGQTHSQNKA